MNAGLALGGLVLTALVARHLSRHPIAVMVLGLLSLGGPIKALMYASGELLPRLDTYPYASTDLHGVFALADTVLVCGFLLVVFHRAEFTRLQFGEFVHRAWPAALGLCGIYVVGLWPDVVASASGNANVGNRVTSSPFMSLVMSAIQMWPVSAAILFARARPVWLKLTILVVFGVYSTLGSGFGRSGLVGFGSVLLVAYWDRLNIGKVGIGAVSLAIAAGAIGAATRGTNEFSARKVEEQMFADIQFLDQTVSFWNRHHDDHWEPRSAAFFEPFYLGFLPRWAFSEKPVNFGNTEVQKALVPVVELNDNELTRKSGGTGDGVQGGFFPVSTWIELFWEFGTLLGFVALSLLALVCRGLIRATRRSPAATMTVLATSSNLIGFFRGGSNWIALTLKSVVIFWIIAWAIGCVTKTRAWKRAMDASQKLRTQAHGMRSPLLASAALDTRSLETGFTDERSEPA